MEHRWEKETKQNMQCFSNLNKSETQDNIFGNVLLFLKQIMAGDKEHKSFQSEHCGVGVREQRIVKREKKGMNKELEEEEKKIGDEPRQTRAFWKYAERN